MSLEFETVSSFESIDPMLGCASYDSSNSYSKQVYLISVQFLLPLMAATAASTFNKRLEAFNLF